MCRPLLGGLTLALALALAGCGSDDPPKNPAASGSPSASGASPSATTGSPSPSQSTTETSTYDAFAPATGTVLTGPITTISAPAGWSTKPLLDKFGGNVNGPSGTPSFNLLLMDSETLRDDASTSTLAKDAIKFNESDPRPVRQPDVVLRGQAAYHLAGDDQVFGRHVDEFGLYTDGHLIEIRVATPIGMAQPKRDEIVGGVMASFAITG